MRDLLNLQIDGHLVIRDAADNSIVLSKHNAVHPQNLALVIARALARDDNGFIQTMAFGNGGTFFNSSNQIVYRSPNTVGASTLYNQTYEVTVDDQGVGAGSNSVTSSASPSPAITSVITVVAQISASDPPGQAVADNISTGDSDTNFIFDEIGLKSPDGLLLSHLVFSPIEKTANRAFALTYTLTVKVS